MQRSSSDWCQQVVSRVFPLNAAIMDLETRDLVSDIVPQHTSPEATTGTLLERMLQSHTTEKDLCIIGGRGQGKTYSARKFAAAAGYKQVETLHLYQDMTARDLLLRR